jgi:hypothetical protein
MEILRVSVEQKKSSVKIDENRYAKTRNQNNGPE